MTKEEKILNTLTEIVRTAKKQPTYVGAYGISDYLWWYKKIRISPQSIDKIIRRTYPRK